jgi:hypothetical protein
MNSSEYTGSQVGQSCSYASLSQYNRGTGGTNPPVPAGNVSGQYIVPEYSLPGYGTLTRSPMSCSGYANISNAYGAKSGSCNTKYVTKLCQ